MLGKDGEIPRTVSFFHLRGNMWFFVLVITVILSYWQSMYKQALQHCKIIPKQTTTSRNSLSASNRSSSPNSMIVSAINENEVGYIYECLRSKLTCLQILFYKLASFVMYVFLSAGEVQNYSLPLCAKWEPCCALGGFFFLLYIYGCVC